MIPIDRTIARIRLRCSLMDAGELLQAAGDQGRGRRETVQEPGRGHAHPRDGSARYAARPAKPHATPRARRRASIAYSEQDGQKAAARAEHRRQTRPVGPNQAAPAPGGRRHGSARSSRVAKLTKAPALPPRQLGERPRQGWRPRHDHVVAPGARVAGQRSAQRLPEPPPHPVAHHGRADLPRHGQTHADPPLARIRATHGLHDERLAAAPSGHAPPPGTHRADADGRSRPCSASHRAGHADRRLRPRARRAAITLRPPRVAMRERNPCRRFRTSLLG